MGWAHWLRVIIAAAFGIKRAVSPPKESSLGCRDWALFAICVLSFCFAVIVLIVLCVAPVIFVKVGLALFAVLWLLLVAIQKVRSINKSKPKLELESEQYMSMNDWFLVFALLVFFIGLVRLLIPHLQGD